MAEPQAPARRFVRVPTAGDQYLLLTRLPVRGREEWFALVQPEGDDALPALIHYPFKVASRSPYFARAQAYIEQVEHEMDGGADGGLPTTD